MKFLALGFKVSLWVFFALFIEKAQSQNYSELLYPNHLDIVHENVLPIIWGCEYCVQPLRYVTKLDWHINYQPVLDSSKNLIDSVILDFSRTPGFSLADVNIEDSNLVQLSSTRLMILPGTSRIAKVKQIDINQIDTSLYAGREQEIAAMSVVQGNKKLFPVIAEVELISKEVADQILYDNFELTVLQKLGGEILSNFSIIYEFKAPAPAFLPSTFSDAEYNTLVQLIDILPNISSPECTIQEIKPLIIRYPFSFWPCYSQPYPITKKIPPSPSLSGISNLLPNHYYPSWCPCNMWCWPYPIYPCWPRPIQAIVNVAAPPPDMSLIAVEAAPYETTNTLPSPDDFNYRPTLVLDGVKDVNGNFVNDTLIAPFHVIEPPIIPNGPKVIYLFLVPNLRAGNGDAEVYIYSRKNQLCHIPLKNGLNGSYFVKSKDRYNPTVNIYNVNPIGGTNNWSSDIERDFSFAACVFDSLQVGIDLKTNPLTKDVNLIPVFNSVLRDDLSRLIYYYSRSRKPDVVAEFRSIYSVQFLPNTLNVYYLIPSNSIQRIRNDGTSGMVSGVTNRRGVYLFDDIIIINRGNGQNPPPESLTHELGHAFGLRHVDVVDVLDCNYTGNSNITLLVNLMKSGGFNRMGFTLAQIMRMNTKPYSSIITNKLRNTETCLACEEFPFDEFYRKDKKCPCMGLDN